ncbi:hypothetical protein KM043_001723 [Ampulex compressa]|nr:hypothetical protein KM043_001723 [Ampulex compressa]
MSLFGSLMGDLDDDPIFGSHMQSMRHMNNMISLFSDPFGMMGQNALIDAPHRGRGQHNDMQMMPFGFPPMPSFNMGRMFADFDNMASNGNCHSFVTRSVTAMGNGPDGRPQVYRETMSTRTAPGGVKETKKTVCDSRTGTKKLAIGHHIGDRAHILEREQNVHNGEQEEHQEFINLDEDEAESFNKEWESHTRRSTAAIGSSGYGVHGGHNRSRHGHKQLALPEPPTSSKNSGHARATSDNPAVSVSTTSAMSSSTATSATRKREHTPETKVCKKRPAVTDSDV